MTLLITAVSEPAYGASQLSLPPGTVDTGTVYRRNGTTLPSIQTGTDANTYIFSVPPTESFLGSGAAAVVNTSQSVQFVRFYTAGVTNAVGSFIVRPDIVRGLSAAQIRDILALPYVPDSLTIVRIPAGTCILTGIAGPITGNFAASPPAIPTAGPWGNGGVEQSYIIGRTSSPDCNGAQFLPASVYVNQQVFGSHALWYEDAVGGGNAGAVARMLDHLAPATPYGDLYTIYNSLDLLNIGDAATLRSALIQLSGESYADFATVEITGTEIFSNFLLSRLASTHGTTQDKVPVPGLAAAPDARAPQFNAGAQSAEGGTGSFSDIARTILQRITGPQASKAGVSAGTVDSSERGRVWASGFGGTGSVSGGDGGAHDVTYDIVAGSAGLDYRINPWLLVGLGLGYAHSTLGVQSLSDSGSIASYEAAVYGSYAPGRWYLDGLLGYAHQSGKLDRTIAFSGVDRKATGKPDANEFFSAFESGYNFTLDPHTVATPFVRLQTASVIQQSFTESGANSINLAVDGQTVSSVRSILGAQLDSAPPLASAWAPHMNLRIGWVHDYHYDSRVVTASFAGAPDGSFTVQGAQPGRDSAFVGLDGSVNLSQEASLFLGYYGNVSGRDAVHAFTGGFRLDW